MGVLDKFLDAIKLSDDDEYEDDDFFDDEFDDDYEDEKPKKGLFKKEKPAYDDDEEEYEYEDDDEEYEDEEYDEFADESDEEDNKHKNKEQNHTNIEKTKIDNKQEKNKKEKYRKILKELNNTGIITTFHCLTTPNQKTKKSSIFFRKKESTNINEKHNNTVCQEKSKTIKLTDKKIYLSEES